MWHTHASDHTVEVRRHTDKLRKPVLQAADFRFSGFSSFCAGIFSVLGWPTWNEDDNFLACDFSIKKITLLDSYCSYCGLAWVWNLALHVIFAFLYYSVDVGDKAAFSEQLNSLALLARAAESHCIPL